ncbi:hypothetical protein L1987_37876 [Smallanthus sonchifolius]|uniref:Uncharacterized protein n=1 Tax=Smallanthus sonchifolius TaxID=185202 RepID=A0ACB9HHY8_9ASTR|nr:hypothetical protein L1987_37876 [Smallanthus sonchifolius]
MNTKGRLLKRFPSIEELHNKTPWKPFEQPSSSTKSRKGWATKPMAKHTGRKITPRKRVVKLVNRQRIEKATRAKDYTVQKGQQTAQTAKEKTGQAKDVVAEKTSGITNKAVDMSKKGASYVGEKAVAAKDVALESGKATAGKVAGAVKDKALVAGWSAAEFASDKAAVLRRRWQMWHPGLRGTKDVLVDVGKKTKDMVVATGESAKDYAARKKTEKKRELEAKNSKVNGLVRNKKKVRSIKAVVVTGYSYIKEGYFEHSGGGGRREWWRCNAGDRGDVGGNRTEYEGLAVGGAR